MPSQPDYVYKGILQVVRAAGSGTQEAEDVLLEHITGPAQVWLVKLGKLQAILELERKGLVLWGDGEPVALTIEGARWLYERTPCSTRKTSSPPCASAWPRTSVPRSSSVGDIAFTGLAISPKS